MRMVGRMRGKGRAGRGRLVVDVKWLIAAVGLACVLTLLFLPGTAHAEEELYGGFFVITDEVGRSLLETGMTVNVGDSFIDKDNRRYEVVSVTGLTARARFAGIEPMAESWEVPGPWWRKVLSRGAVGAAARKPIIGIYHTHSDESYVPTDGSSSKSGQGGIYAVGRAMAEAIKKSGATAEHDPSVHSPHDAAAYDRSRRTVAQLLKRQPAMLIDVHRDSAPREAYETTVAGETVTRAMIVVGRQNPSMAANLAVAKNLKTFLDAKLPGLVKGIFMAQGKYNQDIYPRAILLEFGAESNPRGQAEAAARLVGENLSAFLGQAGGGRGSAAATEGRGLLTALAWIVGLTLIGGAAFLFINAGNLPEARRKLRQLLSTDLAGFLGRRAWVTAKPPTPGHRPFRRRKRNRPPA
jgi:stage II sporulation protein P